MLLGYFISLIQDTTVTKCNIPSISIPRLFSVRPMKVPVARIITTTLDHAYVSIVGPLIMYLKKKLFNLLFRLFFISHKSWHARVIYFTQIQIIPYKMIQDKTKVVNLYLTDIVFFIFLDLLSASFDINRFSAIAHQWLFWSKAINTSNHKRPQSEKLSDSKTTDNT